MNEAFIKGTCNTMCPMKEAMFRQKENLLHKLEMKNGTEGNRRPDFDPEKVIKCFSLSSAGTKTASSSDLRPFPVLLKTIHYMYREVFPLHKDNPVMVYNFMFDRFRAIRQDAIIQNLQALELIKIFEPITKFLIYFGYLLAEENIDNFDGHINKIHLQECVKRLLVCYDECDEFNQDETWDRWNIESAYLLLYLGNVKSLSRGIQKCQSSQSKIYNKCLEFSIQWYLRNYIRVLNLIPDLNPLFLCIANTYLPEIRKYSLQAMSVAFSSRNSAYPTSHLRHLLLYENDSQAEEDCRHFNLKVNNGKINFLKTDFNVSVKFKNRVRLKWVDNKLLNCDLIQLLCFGNK